MSRFFWLLTISVAVVLMLPDLVQEGMFVDGITYATMARNMAEGQGSFWYIFYTPTLHADFHVHPPLAIGILSLFFRIFGDHFWVEKVYSLLTFLVSGFFIVKIWEEVYVAIESKQETANKKESALTTAWLPLLFWLVIPCVNWAYRANMLENTMTIFTTAAAWLILRGLHVSSITPKEQRKQRDYEKERIFYSFSRPYQYFLLAGACILGGCLTKGVIAAFVWAIPFGYWLFFRSISFSKMLIFSLIIVFSPIIFTLLLCWLSPTAATGLQLYATDFLHNVHSQTVSSRFALLGMLVQSLAIPTSSCLLLWIWKRKKDVNNLLFLYFLLFIAACGSLPMMVSLKQADYYMLAAMPFFALALALWAMPNLAELLAISSKTIFWNRIGYGIFVLCLGISLSFWGKIGREKELIRDIKTLTPFLQSQKRISIPPQMTEEWEIHAYFARYLKLGLDAGTLHPYFLVKKGIDFIPSAAYRPIPNLKTEAVILYERK